MGCHINKALEGIQGYHPDQSFELPPRELAHWIRILNRKVDALMADVTALEAIVAEVVSDDAAAATEIAALADTVKSLQAGQTIDQATVDQLTSQLTSATQALASATTTAEAPAEAAPANDNTAAAATADSPAVDAPADAAPAAQDAPSA